MIFKYKIFLLLLAISVNGWCQNEVSYLNKENGLDTVAWTDFSVHSSILPLIRQTNSFSNKKDEISFYNTKIHPISDINYGADNTYRMGAGALIETTWKDKLYLRLSGVGGLNDTTGNFSPKAYLFHPKHNKQSSYYDFRGRLSYTPNSIFNLQTGIDHHFIGEGNRSLLLSDFGAPAPFAQIRTSFWRLDYVLLYQFLHEEKLNNWHAKNIATHYLSINAFKNFNIGVFESVVFQPKDTLLNRGFDAEYLNPIMFFRPQEYNLGSSDNIMMGLQMSYQIAKHKIYGQLILDEFDIDEIRAKSKWWASKYGVQFGVKGRFENKQKTHLIWYRTEINAVRPYTYSHVNKYINYGHQEEVLTHPMGANFAELLVELKYTYKRFGFKGFVNYSLQGENKDGKNYGSNIFESYTNRPFEYGHYMGQGKSYNAVHSMIGLNCNVWEKQNMQLAIENHFFTRTDTKADQYIFLVSLRSNLWNNYRNY